MFMVFNAHYNTKAAARLWNHLLFITSYTYARTLFMEKVHYKSEKK